MFYITAKIFFNFSYTQEALNPKGNLGTYAISRDSVRTFSIFKEINPSAVKESETLGTVGKKYKHLKKIFHI